MKPWFLISALFVCLVLSACAQETVLNVPSGDVLEGGKMYGEVDITYQHESNLGSFTPRFVVGVGRRIELGVNFNGMNTAANPHTVFSPTAKWKLYDGGSNGWAFLVGDSFFIPVQNRVYSAGNYLYAEFVKTFHTGTRATFGTFHFSRDVVASANRAGGQFAIEQPIGKRLTPAADWYTGDHAAGYVSPGLVVKLTPKFTWYASYQIGNGKVSKGNHQLLTEIGWNFN